MATKKLKDDKERFEIVATFEVQADDWDDAEQMLQGSVCTAKVGEDGVKSWEFLKMKRVS